MKTMKIFLSIIFTIFFLSTVKSQEVEKRPTGFGGVSFQNTNFLGEWAMDVGGFGAGYIFNDFYIGGGGYGMTQLKKNDLDYSMGYGGLMLGYTSGREAKTNLNFNLLGGYGSINVEGQNAVDKADGFWVLKPNAEVEFQITSFMCIGVGGGYRLIMGADLPSVDNKDVSAPYGSITFRFGNFGK